VSYPLTSARKSRFLRGLASDPPLPARDTGGTRLLRCSVYRFLRLAQQRELAREVFQEVRLREGRLVAVRPRPRYAPLFAYALWRQHVAGGARSSWLHLANIKKSRMQPSRHFHTRPRNQPVGWAPGEEGLPGANPHRETSVQQGSVMANASTAYYAEALPALSATGATHG